MAELEGKLPWSRWSLSALNFLSSGHFRKSSGMHLQNGLVYLYSKNLLPLLLHFWNYNLIPNGQMTAPGRLNGTKYWGSFIVEYLQPNKFKEKSNFDPIYQVSCFSSLGHALCFHIFPEKGRFSLSAQEKKIMFSRKKYYLSREYKKDHVPGRILLERPSFQEASRKYHISLYFLRKVIFHFPSNV